MCSTAKAASSNPSPSCRLTRRSSSRIESRTRRRSRRSTTTSCACSARSPAARPLAARALEPAEARDAVQDELDHATKLQPMQAESNRKQEDLRVRQIPQIQSQLEKLQQDLKITHSKLDSLVVRAPVAGPAHRDGPEGGREPQSRRALRRDHAGHRQQAGRRPSTSSISGACRTARPRTMEAGDKTWPLKVTRVYPQVKDGTFTVDLAFEGAAPQGLAARPGPAGQARARRGPRRPRSLPAGAFLERSGGDWASSSPKDGRRPIAASSRVGRRNAEQVEVLSQLAPGERVIVSDYTGLERIDRIDLQS